MKVWAHRGASGYLPENTMEAFELAVRKGADAIELDVQMSADGKLFVLHDETLGRVTDGHGMAKEFTLAQLKELKVSVPGLPDGIYRIPALEEVLDLIKRTELSVNIEMKNSVWLYSNMEEKVLRAVREAGLQERVLYSSFNHYSLIRVKKLDASAETGLLFTDGLVDVAEYGKKLGVSALHPAVYHLQYPEFVEKCRAAGLKMHVWTANEPEHIEMVKRAGAEAVITNYPDLARKIALQGKLA